jgi:hypothetical protein
MISDAFACAQIMRLGGLRFFPAQEEAQNELVVALREIAVSELHAQRLITNWLRENTDVPTPADLYRMKPRLASSLGIDPHAEWIPPWSNEAV